MNTIRLEGPSRFQRKTDHFFFPTKFFMLSLLQCSLLNKRQNNFDILGGTGQYCGFDSHLSGKLENFF